MSQDNLASEETPTTARARSFLDLGRMNEALACLDAVLSDEPQSGEAHYLYGVASLRRREPAIALEHLERALACGFDPVLVANQIHSVALLLGDFEKAWQLSDLALECREADGSTEPEDQPLELRRVWDGSELDAKRVLIRCYRGLGDIIQFIRFAPLVHARAKRVLVQAERKLIPLLLSVPGIDGLVAREVPEAAPPHDVDIEVSELPHALRITLATLPADVPYVSAPANRVKAAHRRMPATTDLKVGVACALGDWQHDWNALAVELAALNEVEGVALYSVQRGASAALLNRSSTAVEFLGDDSWCRDLLDTAAMIANLDLLITIDLQMAHLAGALGVPVWTLLDFDSDWRWMVGRDDSPWYPTMRLFRQPAAGDWTTPIARVVDEVRHLVATRMKQAS